MTASLKPPSLSSRCGRLVLPVLVSGLVLGVLAGGPAPARADNIDVALLDAGPKVMHYLQNHGYKTVGVLPFRVEKAGQKPKFNVGELNTKMADRLETTLGLLVPSDNSMVVLHDPAHVAARGSRGATYLTSAGRRGLLSRSYPAAWGENTAKPDVFLTGDVKFTPDNKKATVAIKGFHKAGDEPVIIDQFTVKTDRNILADSGQSFHLSRRALHKRGADGDELAADDATQQEEKGSTPDTTSGASVVNLSVLYDGSPVSAEADAGNRGARKVRLVKRRDGGAVSSSITAPTETNHVSVVIENTSSSETYAVVVKVNGKNTLFEEEDDPIKCHKWVLDPGTRYEIKGFYISETGENMKPFKVLSDEDSKAKESEFKAESLGLIEMVVFTKGAAPPEQMQVSRKLSLRGLSRKATRPRSLAEYKAKLQEKTHTRLDRGKLEPNVATIKGHKTHTVRKGKRGLIVGDEAAQAGGDLNKVDFDNPEIKDSQIIRYYTPGGGTDSSATGTGDTN